MIVLERQVISGDLGKAEVKTQFVELRAKGFSYSKIARRLKVAKGTLANWSQDLEALPALYESFHPRNH